MKRSLFRIGCLLALVGSVAIVTNCSRKQEPKSAPSSSPEEPAEDEKQDQQRTEPAPEPQPAAPRAAEPAGQGEARDFEHEGLDETESLDLDDAAGSGAAESAPARAKKQRISGSSLTIPKAEKLQRHWLSQLDAALEAAGRDCIGAARHRQAICDIAEQICSMLDDEAHRADSRDPKKTCRDARSKCQSARDKYRRECR